MPGQQNTPQSNKTETSRSDLKKRADETRELLNLVTQETRFVLIQNIVAHPEGMPSLKELVYANPSKSETTIRNHLDKLIDAGIVEPVELPKDRRRRDLPYRFYRLTDWARGFLEAHDLLRAEGTLKEMHSMLEKTDEIRRYVDAPRPGEGTSDEDAGDSRHAAKP